MTPTESRPDAQSDALRVEEAPATIRRHAESHRALSHADAYSAQESPRLESALAVMTDLALASSPPAPGVEREADVEMMVSVAVEATAHPHETVLEHDEYVRSVITAAMTFGPPAETCEVCAAAPAPAAINPPLADSKLIDAPAVEREAVETQAAGSDRRTFPLGYDSYLHGLVTDNVTCALLCCGIDYLPAGVLDTIASEIVRGYHGGTPPAEAREPVGEDVSHAYTFGPHTVYGNLAAIQALEAQPRDTPRDSGDASVPHDDETENEYLIRRVSMLLTEIAVIVNGPEPALTSWGYADLPAKVAALAATARGRKGSNPDAPCGPKPPPPPNPPPAKPTDTTNALRELLMDAYRQGAYDFAGGESPPDESELLRYAAEYVIEFVADAALATAQPEVKPEGMASGVVQVCPECDIHGCRHQGVTRQYARGGGEES